MDPCPTTGDGCLGAAVRALVCELQGGSSLVAAVRVFAALLGATPPWVSRVLSGAPAPCGQGTRDGRAMPSRHGDWELSDPLWRDSLQGLKDSVGSMKAEAERETRKKERMEKEMKELKLALEARQLEIKQKQAMVASADEQLARLQVVLKEANQATERVQKEYNLLSEKSQKLHHDLEEQIHNNTQLLAENSQRQVELKVKDDEINQIKQEATRVNKFRETTLNKMKNLEKQKDEVEKARDTMRTEITSLEREIEGQRRGLEQERKKQEELLRERDILNKLKTQAENATQRQVDLVKINENTKRNLEQEVQGYRIEAQKQQKLIYQLEKEREKYGLEASDANSKYMQALEEVRAGDLRPLAMPGAKA